MKQITITCPITWHEQVVWIEVNCRNWKDKTNWTMWQIGMDYIYYELEDKDATWFILKYGN